MVASLNIIVGIWDNDLESLRRAVSLSHNTVVVVTKRLDNGCREVPRVEKEWEADLARDWLITLPAFLSTYV